MVNHLSTVRAMPRLLFKPVAAIIVMTSGVLGCAGPKPERFLADDGRFTPCSRAPHCVSSQAPRDSDKYVEPLHFDGTPAQARTALRAALSAFLSTTRASSSKRSASSTRRFTARSVSSMT